MSKFSIPRPEIILEIPHSSMPNDLAELSLFVCLCVCLS